MSRQEKRVWFMLGVIVVTLAVYALFISLVRFDSTSLAIFALTGFLGWRRTKARRGEVTYDERDRQIERQALLSSLLVFYGLVLVLSIVAGVWHGGDASLPLWMVIQIFWALSLVVWGIKAGMVILLYRRGAHA